jgi:hypothetical protein
MDHQYSTKIFRHHQGQQGRSLGYSKIVTFSCSQAPDVAQDEGQDLVQMNQFFIHFI